MNAVAADEALESASCLGLEVISIDRGRAVRVNDTFHLSPLPSSRTRTLLVHLTCLPALSAGERRRKTEASEGHFDRQMMAIAASLAGSCESARLRDIDDGLCAIFINSTATLHRADPLPYVCLLLLGMQFGWDPSYSIADFFPVDNNSDTHPPRYLHSLCE